MSSITASSVVVNWAATGSDEIMQNVHMILTTPAGTVPFDREFGVNMSFLDLPLERSKAKMTVEYITKINKYEPRASISSVTFEYDELNGCMYPKVVIDLVDS